MRVRPVLLGVVAALSLALGASACSLTKMAANSTVDVVAAGKPSVDKQSDPELARSAIEANIGMMEGLKEVLPEDPRLHALLGEAYTGYAFAFVEDDLDQLSDHDPQAEATAARAIEIYRRGRHNAFEALALQSGTTDLVEATDTAFETALASLEKGDVPSLFWGGNAWGSMINLGQEDPTLVLELPRVEAIMERVLELDPEYFDGGAHLATGIMLASVPAVLADQTDAALAAFDAADAVAGGKNLMIRALKARWVLVSKRDREGFEELLEAIVDSEIESPRHNLVNALARRRAARWLGRIDRYFPGG